MSFLSRSSRYAMKRIHQMHPLKVEREAEVEDRRFEPVLREKRGAVFALTECRDFEVMIDGPMGTGKSFGTLSYVFELMDAYPGIRVLLVRKTRESMTESTLVTWEKVVPENHPMLIGPKRKTRTSYLHTNGSEVVLGGLHNEEAIEKVKSTEYDIVVVEEGTQVSAEHFEILTSRCRNFKMPWQQVIVLTNPGPKNHWLMNRCQSGRMRRFRSKHEDNPAYYDGENWTESGTAYLKTLQSQTGMRRLRNFLGEWCSAEGTVYEEEFNSTTQVIESGLFPYDWERIWITDFGYTNPFVWQCWAIDYDGRMYLELEIYRTQTLLEDQAALILEATKDLPRPSAWICDHDAQDRVELENKTGIPTIAANKSVIPGIDAMKARLKSDRMFFRADALVHDPDPFLVEKGAPTCTIDEFGVYVWKPGVDMPVKENDHGMDAARYGVAYVDKVGEAQVVSGSAGVVVRRRAVRR